MSKVKEIFNGDRRMLLGGANKTAKAIGIDVIFVRLMIAFSFLFLAMEATTVMYVLASAAFFFAERKEIPSLRDRPAKKRHKRQKPGSVHDVRTKLDTRDRKMMAIDHHLTSLDNDQLAREIEELRTKVDARKAEEKAAKPAAEGESK